MRDKEDLLKLLKDFWDQVKRWKLKEYITEYFMKNPQRKVNYEKHLEPQKTIPKVNIKSVSSCFGKTGRKKFNFSYYFSSTKEREKERKNNMNGNRNQSWSTQLLFHFSFFLFNRCVSFFSLFVRFLNYAFQHCK